jgi:outer membrane beta-barrel protein
MTPASRPPDSASTRLAGAFRPMPRTPSLSRLAGVLALALALSSAVARADEPADDAAPATPAATDAAKTPAVTESPVAATPAAPGAAKPVDTISGVTLGESGQRQQVHVLISRSERDEGKNEIALSFPVQVNGKFTEHFGIGLDWAYHLREAFAVTAGGTYYVRGVQSAFTEEELIQKAKQQPFTASALLLKYEGHAGIELSPIYGKFAFFDQSVVQFGFYLGSAFGVGDTRVQLRPADPNTKRDRTFGETGPRPVGIFNAGFRMFFSEHIAFKAEIRDTIFSDEVTRINGCSSQDLVKVQSNGAVSTTCDKTKFLDRAADGAIAADLVNQPSSDVLNIIAFAASISVLF